MTTVLSLVALGAAQITATATIVHVLTGFDSAWAIFISGVVVVFHTWLGGMWSVTLTDFVQFFLIVFGFAIAVPVLDGGWQYVVERVPAQQFGFTLLGWKNIIGLLMFAFTLRATGPFAAYLFGLLWENATQRAGFWSILAGCASAVGIPAIVAGS